RAICRSAGARANGQRRRPDLCRVGSLARADVQHRDVHQHGEAGRGLEFLVTQFWRPHRTAGLHDRRAVRTVESRGGARLRLDQHLGSLLRGASAFRVLDSVIDETNDTHTTCTRASAYSGTVPPPPGSGNPTLKAVAESRAGDIPDRRISATS